MGSVGLVAQSNGVLELYREALSTLVLLRNEANYLPLQGLDTLQIAYVSAGGPRQAAFQDFLERYTPITPLNFPSIATASETQNWINTQTRRFNCFVLSIEDVSASVDQPDYLADATWIKGLMALDRVVLVLFNPQQILNKFPELEKASAILAAADTQEGQSLAAQLIFGGVQTQARLRKPLSPQYSFGAGLDSAPACRLGYAPSELVGLNGVLLRDSIKAIVEEGIRWRAFPGGQVLVAKDGKVVYHQAFGYHTYDNERLVRLNDLYDFASITKISAGLPPLIKWYGEGTFKPDDSLAVYLPETLGSNKAGLSMRRLLTHTARLMAWIPFWRSTLKWNADYPWEPAWDNVRISDGQFKPRTFRPDSSARFNIQVTPKLWLFRKFPEKSLYPAIYASPLSEKPGFVYSDFFFYTMPKIVKQRTGSDFESYLKSTFYHRLGAYTLTFNPLRFYPKDRIIPTERDTFYRMSLLHGKVDDEGASMLGGVSGHAGLFGTANDLAKLMQTYLNGGTYGNEQLFSVEAMREFTRCQYCEAEGIHRGLGFDKPFLEYDPTRSSYAKDASPESFGHTGFTGTFTWADPKHNLLVVFFTNRVHPSRTNPTLANRKLRPRLHQAVYEALKMELK
jgi:CubicO group peptidase (beta-lactamase class C family)